MAFVSLWSSYFFFCLAAFLQQWRGYLDINMGHCSLYISGFLVFMDFYLVRFWGSPLQRGILFLNSTLVIGGFYICGFVACMDFYFVRFWDFGGGATVFWSSTSIIWVPYIHGVLFFMDLFSVRFGNPCCGDAVFWNSILVICGLYINGVVVFRDIVFRCFWDLYSRGADVLNLLG